MTGGGRSDQPAQATPGGRVQPAGETLAAAATLPRVVALLPAWNAEAFIVRALESLAQQTHANLQVLISDDASTDRTAEICERFARDHPNFTVIRQPRNLGWVGNSNALLRAARGDYFFFAYHDDRPRATYVEKLVAALEANPRAVLAFPDLVRSTAAPDGTLRPSRVCAYTEMEGVRDRLARALHAARKQEHSYVVTLTNHGLFRASAARTVGGLRRHIGGEFGADWPWVLHLALLGEFVRVPEPLLEKYYADDTLSASWRYSVLERGGALLSCVREVAGARISASEKRRICRELVVHALKRRWWAARGSCS